MWGKEQGHLRQKELCLQVVAQGPEQDPGATRITARICRTTWLRSGSQADELHRPVQVPPGPGCKPVYAVNPSAAR